MGSNNEHGISSHFYSYLFVSTVQHGTSILGGFIPDQTKLTNQRTGQTPILSPAVVSPNQTSIVVDDIPNGPAEESRETAFCKWAAELRARARQATSTMTTTTVAFFPSTSTTTARSSTITTRATTPITTTTTITSRPISTTVQTTSIASTSSARTTTPTTEQPTVTVASLLTTDSATTPQTTVLPPTEPDPTIVPPSFRLDLSQKVSRTCARTAATQRARLCAGLVAPFYGD